MLKLLLFFFTSIFKKLIIKVSTTIIFQKLGINIKKTHSQYFIKHIEIKF